MKPGQRVIVELRRMIASGELVPGQRIAEIPTAALLQVSRMPVRTALRALEHEGLVVKLGARGYAARGVTKSDIRDAIEVRGVLEGLAARQAVERGLTYQTMKVLKSCLDDGDALFAKGGFDLEALDRYHAMNLRFHTALVEASGNAALASALATNNSLPFAAAAALTLNTANLEVQFTHLLKAHDEHHQVVQALEHKDAQAAETLMRDHAQAALHNMGAATSQA